MGVLPSVAVDTVRGILLAHDAHEHKPRGQGVGSGRLEFLRETGIEAIREAVSAPYRRVSRQTHELDPVICLERVRRRAAELHTDVKGPCPRPPSPSTTTSTSTT